ncbi:Protein lethal(2)essential for life [Halotydeus destructor]|nr:Protein lethal(2)essential for life [Halotydeus destructor]
MSYSRSLIPLMLRSRLADDWLDYDWDAYPSRLVDQHFGQALEDQDFGSFYSSPRSPRNAIAQRQFARQLSRPVTRAGQLSGFSEIADDKDQFAVKVDVSHFGPAEITVKAIDGDTIVIEGRHEEKQDQHGYVSRQFSRRYTLPKDVEVNRITSSLTP